MHASDQRRAPGHLSRQGPPALRWALFEAAQCARRPNSPDHTYYQRGSGAAGRQPRLPVSRAQTAQAQLPHAARTRRGGPATRMTSAGARQALTHTDAPRPAPAKLLPPPQVDGHHRPSGRNASPSGITPSTIMSPTRKHPGSWTEIRLGARAHHNPRPDHDRAPPNHPAVQPSNPESHLTSDGCTDKEPSSASLGAGAPFRGERAVIKSDEEQQRGDCRELRAVRLAHRPGDAVGPAGRSETAERVAKRKPASTVSGEQSDRQPWAGASQPNAPRLASSTDADSAQSEGAPGIAEGRVRT